MRKTKKKLHTFRQRLITSPCLSRFYVITTLLAPTPHTESRADRRDHNLVVGGIERERLEELVDSHTIGTETTGIRMASSPKARTYAVRVERRRYSCRSSSAHVVTPPETQHLLQRTPNDPVVYSWRTCRSEWMARRSTVEDGLWASRVLLAPGHKHSPAWLLNLKR